jgi:hypothetical protein
MFSLLLVACGPIHLGEAPTSDGPAGEYAIGGWPIDACSADLPEDGEGYDAGEMLPQYRFQSQTGETVALHDFCNHVVYLELGYFT